MKKETLQPDFFIYENRMHMIKEKEKVWNHII